MSKVGKLIKRIFAVFVSQALKVIGTGTIIGIELWKAALLAGGLGIAKVVEELAYAYLNDGKLTAREVDEAFNAGGRSEETT